MRRSPVVNYKAKTRLVLSSIAIVATVAFAANIVAIGSAAEGGPAPPQNRAKLASKGSLQPFASCDRLRAYLRRHAARLGAGTVKEMPIAIEDSAGGEASAEGAATAPSAPGSPTNVQEEGVDEPDIVKSSGSTVFAITGDRLRAADVSGDAPAVLGSTVLPDGPGEYAYADDRQLLLSGDRALVISRAYGGAVYGDVAYGGGAAKTLLTEIDVSDPTTMTILSSTTVDGNYVSARQSADTARIVVSSYPDAPVAERGRGRAFLPRAVIHDRVAGESSRRKLLGCADVRRPQRFSGGEMLSVLTIDLATGLPAIDTDAVMAGGEIVYGSPTSLYVATQRWLGPDASASRISDVRTQIHRFDVSDPSSTSYVATGAVEGFMLSQWSMSEHEGVLRVASTTSPPWVQGEESAESESFVTTLAPDGDRLVAVGEVGGLGRGEQIYAVRFIGDAGYVVTFRQVDPLYTLDLSNAADPRVVGELKVPGYSAYLHPIGDGLLLGIGQDASADGITTGVQVSLFDVSDPAAPTRISHVGLGNGTYTEVEYDHHAFTFVAETGLAVLPLEDWDSTATGFYGAAGVRVGSAGELTSTERTAHGSGHNASIRRSLVVDGRLFTVSAKAIAEHDPSTLSQLALTNFTAELRD